MILGNKNNNKHLTFWYSLEYRTIFLKTFDIFVKISTVYMIFYLIFKKTTYLIWFFNLTLTTLHDHNNLKFKCDV